MDVNAIYEIVEKAKKYDELSFINKTKIVHCNFCGKSQNEVRKVVVGQGCCICDECVDLCVDIINEDYKDESK